MQHPSALMRTENFLVPFNLNPATNHRGNDVSVVCRRLEDSAWASRGAEPPLAWARDSPPRWAHPSGRSLVGPLRRVTQKLKGAVSRKEYSRRAGPLTKAERRRSGYKVSTLGLLVNAKTFLLEEYDGLVWHHRIKQWWPLTAVPLTAVARGRFIYRTRRLKALSFEYF